MFASPETDGRGLPGGHDSDMCKMCDIWRAQGSLVQEYRADRVIMGLFS